VTVDELVTYVFGAAPSELATRCTDWATASRRFRAFAESNRDKLRKKARTGRDGAAVLDLEAEVATAFRLVQERRFSVTWEPPALAGGRGPDFAVDFTTRLRFFVEVTRPRLGVDGLPAPPPAVGAVPAGADSADGPAAPARLATAICAKLGQLPPGAINVLVLAGPDVHAGDVRHAVAALRRRAQNRDDAFFTRRGFASARAFTAASHRLSAILLPDEEPPAGLWLNPDAGHPLPAALRTALQP
jgi:hypothetical protein